MGQSIPLRHDDGDAATAFQQNPFAGSVAPGEPTAIQRHDEARPVLTVVLGMHRSGTSAITRGLTALGVELGDELMRPAAGNNDKGFFEDVHLAAFNDSLLEKARRTWDSLTNIPDAFLTGPDFIDERLEAATLLRAKMDAHERFAFKDPRTTVLLPFWRCVFDDINVEDRYVIAVRNPIESAASLRARDGFPMRKGVFLWIKHLRQAVALTADRQRVFISYDRMLNNPEDELTRIAATLGLDAPDASTDAVREYCDSFLDRALRRHYVGAGELSRSGLVSEAANAFYGHLDAWCLEGPGRSLRLPEELDLRLAGELAEADGFFSMVDAVDGARSIARRERDIYAARADELSAKRREDAQAIEQLKKQNTALREEAEAAVEERKAISEELQNAREAVEQARRSNASEQGLLLEAKEAAEARIVELQAAVEHMNVELANAYKEVAERDASVRTVSELLFTAQDELTERAVAEDAHLEEKAALHRQVRTLQGTVDGYQSELAAASEKAKRAALDARAQRDLSKGPLQKTKQPSRRLQLRKRKSRR